MTDVADRNRTSGDLHALGWSQRSIARHVGISQPAVHHVLNALAGKPRDRKRIRTESERRRDRDKTRNPTKTVHCVGCGRLCWRSNRGVAGEKHLCLACRERRNLVRCENPSCGREYVRRRRNDQPGLHNYCCVECLYARSR